MSPGIAFFTEVRQEDPTNLYATRLRHATQELTALSGATVTATNLIPAGCWLVGVTARVTLAITGAADFDIGDGTDVDLWGAAIAIALDTVTDITEFTAAGQAQYTAANNVVMTGNGSFTAGSVRLVAHYIDLIPPQS